MLSVEKSHIQAAPFGRPSRNVCGLTLVLGGITAFAPLIEGGTTHLPVMVIRLLLLSALSVWLVHRLKVGNLVLYRMSLPALVVAFIGLAGLSLLWSPYLNPSLQWFVSLCAYAIFFSLVLYGVESIGQVRVLVMLLLGMGLFEGGVGIVQYVWLGEPRAKGTFFNPNFFATYEVVTLALAFGLLSYQGANDLKWKERVFLGCTAAAAFLAFVMAQSRGAVLAFLILAISVGLYRFGKTALVFLLVLVLGGIVLPNPIKQRALDVSAHDPYAYTRFEMWENSVHRIADRPWGAGLGMYKYSSFQYRFPIENTIIRYGKRAESAHNEYLQIAVEIGVGGLALFFLGMGIWGWDVKFLLKNALPSWEKGAVVGLSGGVLAILAHAAVDSVFHEPALVLLLILCGSLVLVLKRLDSPHQVATWNISFPYHPARVTLVVLMTMSLALLIIQPAAAWFAYERGNHASRQGQNEPAREWYRRATLIDPGTTAYRDALARMKVTRFYESGDPQWLIQAVDDIKICIVLNPLDGRLPYRLGAVYLLLAERAAFGKQRDDLVALAAVSYEDAIKVDPFSPFNYVELGKIRWQQGHVEEAQALFTQAVTYEPNFLPARVLLVKLAMKAGQTDIVQLQSTMIREIQGRYRSRTLSPLEQQYLEVSLDPLDRAITQ